MDINRMAPKEIEDELLLAAAAISSHSTNIEKYKKIFTLLFMELRSKAIKQNYFWQYCSFDVYKNSFVERETSFRTKFPDASDYNFLESENKALVDNCKNNIYYYSWHEEGYDNGLNQINEKRELALDFLSNEEIQRLKYLQERKIEYLNKMGLTKPDESDVLHTRIFTNNNFLLFEHIVNDFIRENCLVKDYSQVYWNMIKDDQIHEYIRPSDFMNWLQSNKYLKEDVLQLYAENRGTPTSRIQAYSYAKDSFKSH